MASLKINNNGDIEFDTSGRVVFIVGVEKIIQRINSKIKTTKGELFYFDEFGIEKPRGKIDREDFEALLRDAILPDEDVIDIEVVSFNKTGFSNYSAHIYLYLDDEEEPIEVEIDDGGVIDDIGD